MKTLTWLTVVIVVVVVLEGAFLAAVVINPDIERTVRNAGSDVIEAWAGTDQQNGIMASYSDAAGEAFDKWIRPLWAAPTPDEADPNFSGCLACHVEYSEQPRYGSLYFDHPIHAGAGIECVECHIITTHPNPPTPAMDTCAACHTEVNISGECQLCHAPGSLDHYERLGVSSDDFQNCTVCHQPGSLEAEEGTRLIPHTLFNGRDSGVCTDCHATDFCTSCHSSDHGDDWLSAHGEIIYDEGAGSCDSCHTPRFCSFCHSDPPGVKSPLPTGDFGG